MKYVFGPVNSRRLGKSLGIDIVPYKVCSFNCIYCECGCTTELTDEVKEYYPYNEIISELDLYLREGPVLDVITFSGSGEPTLNSRIGDIIGFIKSNYPEYRVAVLTNSSLLHREDVRRRLLSADIIYPSLDAVSESVFSKIMRPLPGTDPEIIIESIALLRKEFSGKLCLEIFIIEGLNDTGSELALLKEASKKINPDEIHINHLDRPGAEEWVKPVDKGNLERIRDYFKPLPVRLIGKVRDGDIKKDYFNGHKDAVLGLLHRSAFTAEEISVALNMRLFDVLRALKGLLKKGEIISGSDGERKIYSLK